MLYANQIDIKGIIATTSCWHKTRVNPASIRKVINAYGQVQANLNSHETGYPSSESLQGLVKEGLPVYGMLGVGKGKDSEGSNWILKELENKDDRPLWISIWGGANTLAQALFKIKETKSSSEAKRLISKLRIYTISDQDDSGIWMRKTFPELFYIVSPGDDYGRATWNGIMAHINGNDNSEISNEWLARHIQQGHGPLGASYPDVSWGMEGDSPAFLYLIPNGLNEPEHPEYGGWGGRYEYRLPDFSKQKKGNSGVPFEAESREIWTDASDNYTPYIPNSYGRSIKKDTVTHTGSRVTLWRWRDDIQHDFAARMDWCTLSFEEANHPPIPKLTHLDKLTLKSGDPFYLDAQPTTDPDGDNLSFLWFPYPEAGSYQGEFELTEPENTHVVYGKAPIVKKSETIHIILKVSDKGSPSLSRYKRIILTIVPK